MLDNLGHACRNCQSLILEPHKACPGCGACCNCGVSYAARRGRCWACYWWLRTKGYDRPQQVISRHLRNYNLRLEKAGRSACLPEITHM